MKKYDGYILKEKNGDFWYGTFGRKKEHTEYHLKRITNRKAYGFKVVKVKLVEVDND